MSEENDLVVKEKKPNEFVKHSLLYIEDSLKFDISGVGFIIHTYSDSEREEIPSFCPIHQEIGNINCEINNAYYCLKCVISFLSDREFFDELFFCKLMEKVPDEQV